MDQKPKTSGLAIAALVCGVLSFCTMGVAGLVAVVLGIMAVSAVNKSDGQQAGKGLAVGGIALGAVGMLFGVGLILALIPALNSARNTALMTQDMSTGRQLAVALISYAIDNDGQFPTDLGELDVYAGGNASFESAFGTGAPSGLTLTPQAEEFDPALLKKRGGFWYVLGGLELDSGSPATIMAFSRHVSPDQPSRVVVYLDGHVNLVDHEDLRQLLIDENGRRQDDGLSLIPINQIDDLPPATGE